VRTLACLLAVLALAPAGALAQAEPKTTLSDVEDEVMCPVCGTPLALAENAPQAERERVFIQRMIDQGKSKEEIKDALVAEFGSEVLALPDDEGFDLAAYLVPALAILGALAAIALAATRWRRSKPSAAAANGPSLDARDSKRLDEDLKSYDL
jgi:cytochrome c-type biogenesis protein CcmH